MAKRGEVLVAIINKLLDFTYVMEDCWYRIPKSSVDKWLKNDWPPKKIAFYQTGIFKDDAYSINYIATVKEIQKTTRGELFLNNPKDEKSDLIYYKVSLENIEKLKKQIPSLRFRRIVFIPTTMERIQKAQEINDLFMTSPLEDKLWQLFKIHNIRAERQDFVTARGKDYALDFGIYCTKGKIDVETDGDRYHSNKIRAEQDNLRDNDLKTAGWNVIRFNTKQIREEANSYCLPTVAQNIDNYRGVDEGRVIPRKIDLSGSTYQASLFDDESTT